jgi:hypothetical protein
LIVVMPSLASADEPMPLSGAELQQAMYEALVVIEKARGYDSTASDAMYWNSTEVAQAFDAIPDKQRFLNAVTAIRHRSFAARIGGRDAMLVVPPVKSLNGTAPFTPNYPNPSMDVDYALLYPLGLVANNSSRCDGPGFAEYQAVLTGANISLTAAQLACDAAGCDPTGIACISVCGATKIVQAAYLVALAPVEACKSWESKLDSAENQAAFKNTESLLGDLDAHDDRILSTLASQAGAVDDLSSALAAHDLLVQAALDSIRGNLAAHDGKLDRHDADIKAMLEQMLSAVVANQAEIIKLLKTPEGKRPGWGKEGY